MCFVDVKREVASEDHRIYSGRVGLPSTGGRYCILDDMAITSSKVMVMPLAVELNDLLPLKEVASAARVVRPRISS